MENLKTIDDLKFIVWDGNVMNNFAVAVENFDNGFGVMVISTLHRLEHPEDYRTPFELIILENGIISKNLHVKRGGVIADDEEPEEIMLASIKGVNFAMKLAQEAPKIR